MHALHALARVLVEEAAARENGDYAPPPDLNVLRAMGVPTVSDAEFAAAVTRDEKRRRALYSAVVNDGWSWEDALRITPPPR